MWTDISYRHTTAKDRNNWFQTIFLAGENSNVLIIMDTTVLFQWSWPFLWKLQSCTWPDLKLLLWHTCRHSPRTDNCRQTSTTNCAFGNPIQ